MIPKGMALKLLLLSSDAVENLSNKNYELFKSKIKKNQIELSKEQKSSLKKMNIMKIGILKRLIMEIVNY